MVGIAGVDEPAGHVAEPVQAATRHLVVDDHPLRLFPGRGDRDRAALEIADVVEGVVAAKDVDTGGGRRLDERVDEVVRHLAMADQ